MPMPMPSFHHRCSDTDTDTDTDGTHIAHHVWYIQFVALLGTFQIYIGVFLQQHSLYPILSFNQPKVRCFIVGVVC
jgi:hypothetical protein